jgi:beta-N-acetylhexosaminidase
MTRVLGIVLLCALAADPAVRKAPPKPPPIKASAAVKRWMRNMTARDEVAQLIFVAFHGESPNTRSREYRRFLRLIREVKIGGLILNNVSNGRTIQKAEPYKVAAFLNKMQRLTGVPLMVAGDFERGASMRLEGVTVFPHAMAFGAAGDPALTRYEGEVTAREARALGVHWIYYPVADVNNNPDNPIINIRSFGEDPAAVASHVRAFIEGAHADKKSFALATAKHFPGHGDTAVDTHVNLATIPADRERLDRLELVPFKAAIEAGADAIMTAHIAVPALAPANLPATLSPIILTDLLRKQLGFKGLVVTDALEMAGIAQGFNSGEASVRALEAGADTLLMPTDPDAAIRAVLAAQQSGRLTRQRVQESVVKILSAKERLGLDKKRFVDVEAIGDIIDSPEANEKARRRLPRATAVMLEPSMPRQQVEQAIASLSGCAAFAVAAFAPVTASRGSVGLGGELPHALELLVATGKPVALVALGSPYLLRNFPNVTAYLATFSSVPPSEIAAVKALWGEIPIRGRLPVSIPGLAKLGDGIQLGGKP